LIVFKERKYLEDWADNSERKEPDGDVL